MKSLKVPDEIHERLKIMAAVERKGLNELATEALAKFTEPYKSIRYAKRKSTSRRTQNSTRTN